ncbi:MAG: esterase/lipase family protein [Pseudomonadales bacterium]
MKKRLLAFGGWLLYVAVAICFLFSATSCMLRDLRKDLNSAQERYGYLKGRVTGSNIQSHVVVSLHKEIDGQQLTTNFRTVEVGEVFYFLVPDGHYSLFAFADDNGDFTYQAGEAAARIDDPLINPISALGEAGTLNYEGLVEQPISLSVDLVLAQNLELSLDALRVQSADMASFLGEVTWDDERFSDANVRRGMWEPGAFEEQVGFGLYLLEEFDPQKKSIVLVHGINGSPRSFQALVNRLPADYQILLFHYPSGFPLEHSSNVLASAIEELLRRFDIPQLDILAHSMGGLVSLGMLYQLDPTLRPKLRNFITLATPFAGHAAAEMGTKWAPTVAPVWWSMVPHSRYLTTIASVDLSPGPSHHLVFSFSHETGGESKGNDGVVSVRSQLAASAQRHARGIYGIADDHNGVIDNPCTLKLLDDILADGGQRVPFPDC